MDFSNMSVKEIQEVIEDGEEELANRAQNIPEYFTMLKDLVKKEYDNPKNISKDFDLTRSGSKIAAIKRFKELTHCGLREAKDMVESWISTNWI